MKPERLKFFFFFQTNTVNDNNNKSKCYQNVQSFIILTAYRKEAQCVYVMLVYLKHENLFFHQNDNSICDYFTIIYCSRYLLHDNNVKIY